MAVNQETVQHLADNGHIISPKEISEIAQAEKAQTGNPVPAAGGLTATAQSLHDKQQNFLVKEAEIEKKPESDITKDDAKEIQSAESIADKNEKTLPSEVGKDEAAATIEKDESVASKVTEVSEKKEQSVQESQ
ncbi:seed maturation protein pm25-like protein [Colletotrichum higginsianum]|nr:seed maturation protein pm25-like protein [Colletotrichum higginsianum]